MKILMLALLLLSCSAPASAYRIFGIGRPSLRQRPNFRHMYLNGRVRWVRNSRAVQQANKGQ